MAALRKAATKKAAKKAAPRSRAAQPIEFTQSLVLNQWLFGLFGLQVRRVLFGHLYPLGNPLHTLFCICHPSPLGLPGRRHKRLYLGQGIEPIGQ